MIEHEQEELDALGSDWIDVTKTDSRYQHLINRDGRERWRPYAAPDDLEPPEWRRGRPPSEDKAT